MKSSVLSLGRVLGLRPLDRVQINSAHEVQEMWISRRQGENFDLPYLYFQRVLADGRLEVRSPGGYVTAVFPSDICDIVPGVPMVVRAIPERVFRSRLGLSPAERQNAPGPECYAEAFVLYANKNRWGQVDAAVWFKDATLNSGRPWMATIHDEDNRLLQQKARRTNMPVMSGHGAANHSADHNLWRELDFARDVAKKLIAASLAGNRETVDVLTTVGAQKISRATLNSLA